MMDKLTITKLDAARRQLETAVRLFFEESDPVSIHTLASAALEIIRTVNHNKNRKPLFRESEFLDLFRPEARKGVRKKLNQAANFFKHADRDPTAAIVFKPIQSEFVLMEACQKFEGLSGQTIVIFNVFLAWYGVHHTGVFVHPPEEDAWRLRWQQHAGQLSKQEFIHEMLPIAEKKYPAQRADGK